MIFVTVGTALHSFDRLVRAVDELASEIEETVIIQRGTTSYEPKSAQSFQWATGEEMEGYAKSARIIISQASAGAVIAAIKKRKPLVVVPRQAKYGEHYDDHQMQLARSLDGAGKAVVIYEPSRAILLRAIDQAVQIETKQNDSLQLIQDIRKLLMKWDIHHDDAAKRPKEEAAL